MAETRQVFVASEDADRVDRWLAQQLGISRSRVQALFQDERVTQGGAPVRPSRRICVGESVEVRLPPERTHELVAQDIVVDILHEDDHVIVVAKPAGLVVHPGRGHPDGTLCNALLDRMIGLPGHPQRPGIVHRLDKNTSGLLVIALDDTVHRRLAQMMRERNVHRLYIAYVWGHPRDDDGVIDAPVGRHPRVPTRTAVVTDGRRAVTRYALERRHEFLTRLSVELETGRTHQIRVHLAHIGHHVFGDPEYGGRDERLGGFSPDVRLTARRLLAMIDRQALHAARLSFQHPVTGEDCLFEGRFPADMAALERALECG